MTWGGPESRPRVSRLGLGVLGKAVVLALDNCDLSRCMDVNFCASALG